RSRSHPSSSACSTWASAASPTGGSRCLRPFWESAADARGTRPEGFGRRWSRIRWPSRPIKGSSPSPPALESPFMANLGFLGLGLMGYPMARNLLRAGHRVALWSNTTAKARQLASDEKGVFCDTPRQVAEQSDCIFLCVGNTEMSREVILGKNGIIEGAKTGT